MAEKDFKVNKGLEVENGITVNGGAIDFTSATSIDITGITQTGFPSGGSDYLAVNSTGTAASATGTDALAIGETSVASGSGSVSVGNQSDATATKTVAVGEYAQATANDAVAIGANADAITGVGTIAIGHDSTANDTYAIAIGTDALGAGNGAIAIGEDAKANNNNTVCIGRDASTSGDNSIVIGDTASVGSGAADGIAIGSSASCTALSQSIAIGAHVGVSASNTVMIGNDLTANSSLDNSVIISAGREFKGGKGVIIGMAATTGTSTADTYNVALGYDARASGSAAICVGSLADATGGSSTAVGTAAQALATDATGLGYNAHAEHSNATAVGHDSATNAANSFHLGNSSISDLRCQDTSITAVSDERDKTEIEDLTIGLDFVNEVAPKSFYKNNRNNYFDRETREFDQASYEAGTEKAERLEFGWIAQQVAAALEETAGYEDARLTFNEMEYFTRATRGDDTETRQEKMDVQRFTPGDMVPILWKAVQELSAQNDELEARIAALES